MPSSTLRRGSVSSARAQAPTTFNTLALNGTNLNYFQTPDSAANSVTGDIDIRVKLAPVDWTAAGFNMLVDKFGAAGQRSYQMYVSNTGRIVLGVTTDGTNQTVGTSSASVAFTDGQPGWVRATRAAATGTATFYTSADGSSWAQLGTTIATTAGNIFNSTTALRLGELVDGGGLPMNGKLYTVELRNGIDGSVVAKFDATAVTKIGTRNPSSVVASTGETWSGTGSAWDWVAA